MTNEARALRIAREQGVTIIEAWESPYGSHLICDAPPGRWWAREIHQLRVPYGRGSRASKAMAYGRIAARMAAGHTPCSTSAIKDLRVEVLR